MHEYFEMALSLLPGLWVSIQMAAASLVVGIPLGFFAGLALNGRFKALRWLVIGLVEILRGFPALLAL